MATVGERAVNASAGWLDAHFSRRSFLAKVAVVGAALATAPLEFVLRPVSAYAAVCGPANSCADGYSVMCCSINNGVNMCPPGTFAGGWWMADNASLCGGGPRYYIDCQAECAGCSSGCDPFCDPACANYGCRCNDDPRTCDHRLVACNVFRYGQCNEQIACSGAVVCRQISCRPPYEWLPCSSVSAVDQYTVDHSSDCLPDWDPIQARYYAAFGGEASFLGPTVRAEYPVAGGLGQDFVNGRMLWSSGTGAWSVHGAILGHYESLGGPAGLLGFPVTDESGTPDGIGRYNHFSSSHDLHSVDGSIYWTPGTGPWAVTGAIRARWASMGWERSPLGYPTSDPYPSPGGQRSNFQHGTIGWDEATGTTAVDVV